MADDDRISVVVDFQTGLLPSNGISLKFTVVKSREVDAESKAWVLLFAMHAELATELGLALIRAAGETSPGSPPHEH
jgi:hypothetical protein